MNGQFETIENVTCRNITLHNTKNGAYIKTLVMYVKVNRSVLTLLQMDWSEQGTSTEWRWWRLRLCAKPRL
jgi:hypothetical protein